MIFKYLLFSFKIWPKSFTVTWAPLLKKIFNKVLRRILDTSEFCVHSSNWLKSLVAKLHLSFCRIICKLYIRIKLQNMMFLEWFFIYNLWPYSVMFKSLYFELHIKFWFFRGFFNSVISLNILVKRVLLGRAASANWLRIKRILVFLVLDTQWKCFRDWILLRLILLIR